MQVHFRLDFFMEANNMISDQHHSFPIISPYPVMKILSAFYICCKISGALQTDFYMEVNDMNPEQTAPKGAV